MCQLHLCRTIQPAAQDLPAPAVPSTGRLGWTGLDWTEAASHKAAHCCTCRSLLMFRYVIVVLTGAMILFSYLECILFVFAPHMWVRLVRVLLLSWAQDLEMRMHRTDRSGCLWSLRRSGSPSTDPPKPSAYTNTMPIRQVCQRHRGAMDDMA